MEQYTARTFLACWPGSATAEELENCSRQMQSQVGGRRVATENLHVTLAFLGELTAPQVSAVISCCHPLPARFRIKLDRLGFWQNRGLVWIGAREADPEFTQFVEDLRHRLRRLGFRIDQRLFVPHITLLRKARRRPRIVLNGLEWTIDEYTLSASELRTDGARYSVLNRWSTI